MVYPALLPLMRTPRLPVVDWTDAPTDFIGLVRFAERRNLSSARVPSHFKRSLVHICMCGICLCVCYPIPEFMYDIQYTCGAYVRPGIHYHCYNTEYLYYQNTHTLQNQLKQQQYKIHLNEIVTVQSTTTSKRSPSDERTVSTVRYF
jgi:hypothetical protein